MSQKASLTCFILLQPSWRFGTKAEVHSAGHGSCSSWVLGACHRQKLKHFVKGPSGPLRQKTNTTNGIQLLTDTVFSCFFHIQVCKFLFEDVAYEMIWMGTLWFLVPAGFQSLQRPPAPRQCHAQGQALRKAAYEHDLGKNPQILLAAAVPNAQKTCWPTHLPRAVQGLGPAFTSARSEIHSRFPWSWEPGCSLRDCPSRCVSKIALILQPVDTRSLRSARRRIVALGKFMIDIWSLQRLAWLSRLSTLSESYTPQK